LNKLVLRFKIKEWFKLWQTVDVVKISSRLENLLFWSKEFAPEQNVMSLVVTRAECWKSRKVGGRSRINSKSSWITEERVLIKSGWNRNW
jgi:hypothetical protein